MNRLPQRRRRIKALDRTSGEWLTPLRYKSARVWRKGLFGRITKDGYELTAPLLYADYANRLWVFFPGYVWDGPSYPSFLSRIVGDPNLEALLAASALHDAMGPNTLIYNFDPRFIEFIRSIAAHNSPDLIRNMLFDMVSERIDISIIEGAKLYRHASKDWPNKNAKITWIQRKLQSIGLLLFQRKVRLFTGGKHQQWRKVSE